MRGVQLISSKLSCTRMAAHVASTLCPYSLHDTIICQVIFNFAGKSQHTLRVTRRVFTCLNMELTLQGSELKQPVSHCLSGQRALEEKELRILTHVTFME